MAALLKKRALAEFSHVIQEEPKPVNKKLRLTYPAPKPQESPVSFKECTSPSEICSQLINLRSILPVTAEVADTLISQIKAYYYPDQDSMVKSLIVSLLGELGRLPNVTSSYICDEMVNWLKEETSHKLTSRILSSLTEIGKSLPCDTVLIGKLLQTAIKNLRDSSHLVRCKCLEMIGCLGSPDQVLGSTPGHSQPTQMLQGILGNFTNDNDPRVRSSAFKAMINWHERGIRLEQSLYDQACTALADDYEGVRLSAVLVVWILSQLYPDSMVKSSAGGFDEIRLVDDGFARICNMVNDISFAVRAKAAELLGSLHSVSPCFLEQTLDKKLMSNMRHKQSAHQRNKEHYESGEWATGQKWADDAPKEEVEAESVSLISSGACGAFVHGLEDEFLEVRNAAIDSLCELATQSAMFAILSQDFLVDMLNDEIDVVRLNAINSLRKISHHITLREDQLDGVLDVLKDFAYDIREALREMFCGVGLGTKNCLNTCVLALLDNMRRYPADRDGIWKCLQHLGRNHSYLVMLMTPELMSSHPYFESHEPEVDDPAYIGVLLLVFNAAVSCPTMISLFPDYAKRHYNYLRDTIPHLVPKLQLCLEAPHTDEVSTQPSIAHTADFLSETLRRLSDLKNMNTASALQLLDMGIRDLQILPQLEPTLTATAGCHRMYLHCQKLILKMLKQYKEDTSVGASSMEKSILDNHIQQVHQLTREMEQCFVGLGSKERLQIKQLRLRVHTLQLLQQLQSPGGGSKASCVHFLQILNSLQKHFTTTSVEPDPVTAHLLLNIEHLESFELSTYSTILEAALELHRCHLLQLEGKVQQASGQIIEPTGKSETALRFIAGLTAGIDLVAALNNVENTQDVCICVCYPDQQKQYMTPKALEFRQLGPLRHRLITKVLLSHNKWSEPCHIELCLVLRYKEGITIKGKTEASSSANKSSSGYAYIELCKPVRVLLAPSGEKR